jgi:hypothetical protein
MNTWIDTRLHDNSPQTLVLNPIFMLGGAPEAHEVLSKTPRIEILLHPKTLPEAFPIKASDNPPGTRKLNSISLVDECVGMKSSFENPHSASSVDNR